MNLGFKAITPTNILNGTKTNPNVVPMPTREWLISLLLRKHCVDRMGTLPFQQMRITTAEKVPLKCNPEKHPFVPSHGGAFQILLLRIWERIERRSKARYKVSMTVSRKADRERSRPVRCSLLLYIDSKRKMSKRASTPASLVLQGRAKTEGAENLQHDGPTSFCRGACVTACSSKGGDKASHLMQRSNEKLEKLAR